MLTPVSRDFMRELKAMKDEEKRAEVINKWVTHTYNEAIKVAELHGSSRSGLDMFDIWINHRNDYELLRDNMEEILSILQGLFCDCIVTYNNVCIDSNGKTYDLLEMDRNKRGCPISLAIHEGIVIDWS